MVFPPSLSKIKIVNLNLPDAFCVQTEERTRTLPLFPKQFSSCVPIREFISHSQYLIYKTTTFPGHTPAAGNIHNFNIYYSPL